MATIPIRLLIISDTHNAPLLPKNSPRAFRKPPPECDILLHTGDLTSRGDLTEYKETLQMLKQIKAELKLVIAGNHDLTLDRNYVNRSVSNKAQISSMTIDEAHKIWHGPLAKEAGVTYLSEGLHSFTLASGARLRVYASPYTPEFCNWGFDYKRNEDRWNTPESSLPNTTNIAENPVPDFPGVDIVMTHGPPENHLGQCYNSFHAGCRHLLHALKSAKPRLHCFGHIHEAWGAERLQWVHEGSSMYDTKPVEVDLTKAKKEGCAYVDARSTSKDAVMHGKGTLLINAAIMDLRYEPTNAPWLVDMDFPRG